MAAAQIIDPATAKKTNRKTAREPHSMQDRMCARPSFIFRLPRPNPRSGPILATPAEEATPILGLINVREQNAVKILSARMQQAVTISITDHFIRMRLLVDAGYDKTASTAI
jgi:hypothetical protein